jgi:phosphoribosylamine--glycine ligase
MKVLVVGSGGRECALAWAISESPRGAEVIAAPGNPGVESFARRVPIDAGESEALVRFVREEGIRLTVIGPEQPLVAGLADRLEAEGFAVFGPSRAAAALEGSKVFAKEIMAAAGVPTARHEVFDDPDAALARAREIPLPAVVKADGLAAGKGVVVARGRDELVSAVGSMLSGRAFGQAGRRILLEEFLSGREVSVLAITDGTHLTVLPPARDYKRALDGDTGPNTGGMGSHSPVPDVGPDLMRRIRLEILEPVLSELRGRGIVYRGCLYAGLMLTDEGPKVLEFNCRFGDPETQALLPVLDADLLGLLLGASGEGFEGIPSVIAARGCAVCIVLASGGYPGDHGAGQVIEGLAAATGSRDVILFHAATRRIGERIMTAGGRVLGVVGRGATLTEARLRAYDAVEHVRFERMQYRRDIAASVAKGTSQEEG